MRCERYWREGVLLVEQGRPDPHREDCLDCRREHEARGDLVRTFRLVGARGGDPRWQARVWRGIAAKDRPGTPWVPWVSALAAACVLIAFVSTQGLLFCEHGDPDPHDERPRHEIVRGEIAMRSTSASIGDRVRIWVRAAQEARLYRAEKLILRCAAAAATATAGCSRDDGGLVVEHVFALPGDYQLVIAPAGILPAVSPEPAESLDRDLAAITAAGHEAQLHELPVR